MGRADQKVMYESFGRSITIGFKLAALERTGPDSVESMINRLNVLSKAVTPAYVDGKGFVGRFVRFSIARLWSREYCFIESLNVAISNEVPWKTDRNGQGERPMVFDVDMTLTWVGDKRPDSNNPQHSSYDLGLGDLINTI
jgi:hypothetical protein